MRLFFFIIHYPEWWNFYAKNIHVNSIPSSQSKWWMNAVSLIEDTKAKRQSLSAFLALCVCVCVCPYIHLCIYTCTDRHTYRIRESATVSSVVKPWCNSILHRYTTYYSFFVRGNDSFVSLEKETKFEKRFSGFSLSIKSKVCVQLQVFFRQ